MRKIIGKAPRSERRLEKNDKVQRRDPCISRKRKQQKIEKAVRIICALNNGRKAKRTIPRPQGKRRILLFHEHGIILPPQIHGQKRIVPKRCDAADDRHHDKRKKGHTERKKRIPVAKNGFPKTEPSRLFVRCISFQSKSLHHDCFKFVNICRTKIKLFSPAPPIVKGYRFPPNGRQSLPRRSRPPARKPAEARRRFLPRI